MMDFTHNKKIESFTAKLGKLRQDHPALRRGSFNMIVDDGPKAVFKRTYKNETLYIVFNNSKKDATVTIKDKALNKHKLVSLLNEDEVKAKGKKAIADIKSESAQIYVLKEDSSSILLFVCLGVVVVCVILAVLYLRRKKIRKV
jgi:alpha-amylase